MGSVAGIVIEAQAGKEIAPRLAQLAARLADLTPVMEDIGAILERNVQLRFDAKADPAGRAWKPLAASTRVAYAKAGVAGSLLERTRLMRESLNSQAGKDSVVIGFGRPPADGRSHAGILDPTSRSAGSPSPALPHPSRQAPWRFSAVKSSGPPWFSMSKVSGSNSSACECLRAYLEDLTLPARRINAESSAKQPATSDRCAGSGTCQAL